MLNSLPTINLVPSTLPSKGLPYPKNVEISYRPYTFGETSKISESKLNQRMVADIVLEGVTTKGMDKNDLTFSDFLWIALLRKISTIGDSDFKISFNCPDCGHLNTIVTSLEKVEFDDIRAKDVPVIVDFPEDKISMEFRPLTIYQFLEVEKAGLQNDKIALLASQCKIKDKNYEQIYELIFDASNDDGLLFTQVDELMYHGVKPIKYNCLGKLKDDDKVCGSLIMVEPDGGQAMILPFRPRPVSSRGRIRFGVQNESKSN